MAFYPLSFIRELRAEVSKVSWPSLSEASRVSVFVFFLMCILSLVLACFDYIFRVAVLWILA